MFGRKIIAELAETDEDLFRSPLTPSQEAFAVFASTRESSDASSSSEDVAQFAFAMHGPIWSCLCIVASIVLGQTIPAVFRAIGAATVAEVNLPVAVLMRRRPARGVRHG